ncbi:pyridoxal phosphate-dependent aminotransferase [Litchfieldia alkalitelluris]|uniref:pyridoxal phosphate-dependent aminotransferase n=1 Tax=Litchfieldia alkalitelluris TaxID=304268 RepID=UPI00147401B9|nr:pyridoxal phosphate-dependent aminotransferase [Litchfieldia alkalitelluris]
MTISTATRLSKIPFSSIREIFNEANEMEKRGIKLTHMEIGRPDFDTPLHIKAAANDALQKGFVHYTANQGIPELREVIAEKLKLENNVTVDPNKGVVVSVGCKEAIVGAIFAFINPGDEVLIPDPAWLEYQYIVELAGGIPVSIPLHETEGFILRPNDVRDKLNQRTKMIILNSPHNPTGSVLPEKILKEIAEIAIEANLLVLSDEIYEKLIYGEVKHVSIASLPGMFERTVIINGFSKAYAMDGWRLGYAAGPEELIQPILKVHQYNTSSATSFAQYGAVAAYIGSQEPVYEMVKEFDNRRQLLINRLLEMENVSCVVPEGAFYVFPSFKEVGMSSKELATFLLREAQIACVPGSAFGQYGEGYIRMAYSTDYEQINQAMDRLDLALKQLRVKGNSILEV